MTLFIWVARFLRLFKLAASLSKFLRMAARLALLILRPFICCTRFSLFCVIFSVIRWMRIAFASLLASFNEMLLSALNLLRTVWALALERPTFLRYFSTSTRVARRFSMRRCFESSSIVALKDVKVVFLLALNLLRILVLFEALRFVPLRMASSSPRFWARFWAILWFLNFTASFLREFTVAFDLLNLFMIVFLSATFILRPLSVL